eukprot:6211990-Pleurochrysis_carterae.AAC.9
MALGKPRQVIVPGGWRCEGRPEDVRKRRGQGGRGDAAHRASWYRRSQLRQPRRQKIEVSRNSAEEGRGGRSWGRRRRGKRVRLSQGIRDRSQATGGPWMHLDANGEREQVEVEDSVLWHEGAEEGRDIGRHVKAFGVNTE